MHENLNNLPKAPQIQSNNPLQSALTSKKPTGASRSKYTKVDYDVFDNNIELATLMRTAAKKYLYLKDHLSDNDALLELLKRDERLNSSIVKVFEDRIASLEEQSVQLLETTIQNNSADGTAADIENAKDILENVPFD